MADYGRLVARLLQVNRFTAVKRGLLNMERLNAALGDPAGALPAVVHVTGSNGKGSVCWKVREAARLSGLRTGLFVSPHVSCFRERVQLDGEPISEASTVALLEEVFAAAERDSIPATFFELTTALALTAFSRADLDLVVLEAGLGGSLDSTNVVRAPAVTVLTSIALEHTKVLGATHEAIAADKAGIAKRGAPMLLGPSVPRAAVEPVARAAGASEVVQLDGGRGDAGFDHENARVARAVLEMLPRSLALSPGAVEEGLAARPPCRVERVLSPQGVPVILDAGHNLAALRRLFQTLDTGGGPIRTVFAVCNDKGAAECARLVAEASGGPERVHVVQSQHPRAASAADLNAALDGRAHCDADGDVAAGVRAAIARCEPGETVVVTGTLFMMADARAALGIQEPVDAPELRGLIGSAISADPASSRA